jgi:hypothetical protein
MLIEAQAKFRWLLPCGMSAIQTKETNGRNAPTEVPEASLKKYIERSDGSLHGVV